MNSAWLVRSYLRRPQRAPSGLRHGSVGPTYATHIFYFQRRAPTTRAAIGFLPRLAPRIHRRIAQANAESTRFGQTAGPPTRSIRSHRCPRAEPSDTPSHPPDDSHSGEPLRLASVEDASTFQPIAVGSFPHPRVPSPPGTPVKGPSSVAFGHRNLEHDALHSESLDPQLGIPPAKEPQSFNLQSTRHRLTISCSMSRSAGTPASAGPPHDFSCRVVQAPEDPPSRVAIQRGAKLPTQPCPIAMTPRHPLSSPRAREDWDFPVAARRPRPHFRHPSRKEMPPDRTGCLPPARRRRRSCLRP